VRSAPLVTYSFHSAGFHKTRHHSTNFCGHYLCRISSKSDQKNVENSDKISFTPLDEVPFFTAPVLTTLVFSQRRVWTISVQNFTQNRSQNTCRLKAKVHNMTCHEVTEEE